MKYSCKLSKDVCSIVTIAILLAQIGIIPVIADEIGENEEKVYCNATVDEDFTDNEIIVVLMKQYRNQVYNADDFSEIKCVSVVDLFYNEDSDDSSRIIMLTLPIHSKENVLECIKLLEHRDDVCSAEPNYRVELCGSPDDQYYVSDQQWAIDKISLPAAWDITTGSSTVYVGVIDTGIDGTHSDLVNRVDTELSRGFTEYASDPLIDSKGHGTKVAGVIGAEGDNSIGVTGACWNVKLVSLRVTTYNETNNKEAWNSNAIINAIDYANEVGIPILNMSFGVYSTNYYERSMNEYFGLMVCSAGNDAKDNDEIDRYPCNANYMSNVISVGASDSSDEKCDFSNYGANRVDLFAPGASILTTASGGLYARPNGTSVAAPYVAGVAALMLSTHPLLTPAQIKNIILDSVDPISELSDLCVSGGRLNAYKALTHEDIHTNIHYFNNGVDSGHTVECSNCDYTCSESHTWVSTGSKIRCSKCGVITTTAAVTPFMLPPQLLAQIEQMNYIGDFAMDIGDGTVLCRVGDDYYLVAGQTEDAALQYLQYELGVIVPDLDVA